MHSFSLVLVSSVLLGLGCQESLASRFQDRINLAFGRMAPFAVDAEDTLNILPSDIEIPVEERRMSKRSNPVRLCGNRLVNAIRLTCQMEQARGKRSADFYNFSNMLDNEVAEAQLEQYRIDEDPLNGLERFEFHPKFKILKKRGAADSCCTNACSISHLATYC